MERGRANKVRIYNIDEGMSPVYYNGDSGPYDPSMPVGLRLEKDDNSALESLETNHFNLNPKCDITTDARKLWRWSAGQWHNSVSVDWSSLNNGYHTRFVNHDHVALL